MSDPANHRPTLGPLSPEAQAARAPLRPEELVGALHDRVHRDPGDTDRAALAWPCPACKKPAGIPCYRNGQTHTARQRQETT